MLKLKISQKQGFTLVELLIVITVIAVIAVIAYPMYLGYVQRAACDDGKAGMLQAASLVEQSYMQYGKYDNALTQDFPIKQLPIDGSAKTADFTLTLLVNKNWDDDTAQYGDVVGYTLRATVTSTGRLSAFAGGWLEVTQDEKYANINGYDIWQAGCATVSSKNPGPPR